MQVDLKKTGSAEAPGDHGADRGRAAIASRPAFDSPEQSVRGFEETVGHPRLRPGNGALGVRVGPKAAFAHGLGCGAPGVGVPWGEQRAPGRQVPPMGEPILTRISSPRRMSHTECAPPMPGTARRPSATKSMRTACVRVAASSPMPAMHRSAANPEAVRDILSVRTAGSIATAVLFFGYPHGFQQRH